MSYGIDEKEQILFERELERLSEKRSGVLGGRLEPDDSLPDYFFKQKTKQQQKQKQPAATKIEPETNIAKVVDPFSLPPIPQIRKPILRRDQRGGPGLPPPSLLTPGKRPVTPALAKPEIQVKQPAISKAEPPKVTLPKPEIKPVKPPKFNIPITKPDLAKTKIVIPKVELPKIEPKPPTLKDKPFDIKKLINPKAPVLKPVTMPKVPQLEPPPSKLVGKDKFVVKIDKQYVLKMDKNGRYYRQNIKNPGDTNWIKYKDAAEIIKKHQQAAKPQDYKPAIKKQANKQVLKKTGTGDAPEEPSKKLQQKIDKAKDTQTVKDQSGKKKDSAIKQGVTKSNKVIQLEPKKPEIKPVELPKAADSKDYKVVDGKKVLDPKKHVNRLLNAIKNPAWRAKASGIGGFAAFVIADAFARQQFISKVEELQDTLDETDPRKFLSPTQFFGGADSSTFGPKFGSAGGEENNLFTKVGSGKLRKESQKSFENMKYIEDKDISKIDLLQNNIQVLTLEGDIIPIKSKEQLTQLATPFSVIQVTKIRDGAKRLSWKEMGENINTYYVNGKPPPPPNKDEQEVKDVVGNPFGKEGAPTTFADYESTMQKLSKESRVPIQILRALGKHESGIHVSSTGNLSSYSYRGDKQLGTAGSFGMFHVRSDPKKGAAVEEYNKANNTNYTWKDTASNPIVAATIGAWYFKYWLDKANGDPYLAYMYYNGGPKGPMKPQARANAKKFRKSLQYYNVKENFVNTSSILEGISKVNT